MSLSAPLPTVAIPRTGMLATVRNRRALIRAVEPFDGGLDGRVHLVTLGLLHALKGVGNRAFYRWLTRDYRPLFPRLPERTRLFRLLKTSPLRKGWQKDCRAPTKSGGQRLRRASRLKR